MGRDDPELWETKIAGERMYSGRILDLEIDRVALPSSGEAVREVVRHRGESGVF